jgi:hypothetical protein
LGLVAGLVVGREAMLADWAEAMDWAVVVLESRATWIGLVLEMA